jgi:hypothetical protein
MSAAIAALVVALAFVIALTIRRSSRSGGNGSEPLPEVEISAAPDTPIDFGRKTMWLAVPTDDAAGVVQSLGLSEAQPSNWQTGFAAAYTYPSDYVFVTSPVQGWIFALGTGLPDPSDSTVFRHWQSLLESLSARFGRALFFASHRVSSYSAWAVFQSGRQLRLFAYADQIIHNAGTPLPEEAELMAHLLDPDSPEAASENYWDREDLRTPDEDDVLRLAAAWSVDPSSLESLEVPPSVGTIGRLVHR